MNKEDFDDVRKTIQTTLDIYGGHIGTRVAALEERVVAAEAVSRAATAQMTAVLAVLNVLAQLAPKQED